MASLEKSGRYNTKWQLRAFKYSHDRPYRRETVANRKKKKIGKTTSNFLILKAVYVLFSRNPELYSAEAIQPDLERTERRLFYGRGGGGKKRN